MSRSIWKGPFLGPCFFRESSKKKAQDILIYSRSSVILPRFVGQKVQVHNGMKFQIVQVTEEMVGHKFGEFSLTKRKPIHKVKTKK